MCKKNTDNSCNIYELTFEELESSGSGSKCITLCQGNKLQWSDPKVMYCKNSAWKQENTASIFEIIC